MKKRKFGVSIGIIILISMSILIQPQLRALSGIQATSTTLPLFTDVSVTAGIDQRVSILTWGASWGDFNGDSLLDLFAGNHNSIPGFFRNNGDGTFTNIVESTPLNNVHDRHGALWGDYDNDGDQDLFITAGGQKGQGAVANELYNNIGPEQFVNVAEAAGVDDAVARSRSGSWGDFDHDGHIDAFVATNLRPEDEQPNRLWRNNGDGTFTDVAEVAGVAASQGLFAGGMMDFDFDGWPDIFVLGEPNLLYHNNRDGTFEDISAASGFAGQNGSAYAWGDYDNDGDADLVIGTASGGVDDHIQKDDGTVLFIGDVLHDSDGFDFEYAGDEVKFDLDDKSPGQICIDLACIHIGENDIQPTEDPFIVGSEALGAPTYTPGVDSGYYLWRDEGTDIWHVRWSEGSDFKRNYAGILTTHSPVSNIVPIDMEHAILPTGEVKLWRNEGDGTFTKLVNADIGMDIPGNYRTANWVDFDNDGWLDLFLGDQGNLQNGNGLNRLFFNNRDGTFTDVSTLVGFTSGSEGGTNVSIWGDYDQNGFLDLFIENGGWGGTAIGKWPFNKSNHQLFRNEGNDNHWLDLDLVGQISNRDGLGAIVRITAGGHTQVRSLTDGSIAKSQDGNPFHFGLGNSPLVDTIIIDWPSGIHQVLTDIAVDQQLTVIEPISGYSVYLPLIIK